MSWPWLALGVAVALYAAFVLALVASGRRESARAVAGFVPDCAVLFRRLLADPRLPWAQRALIAVLIAYLLSPIDLVPDFVPVAGQLDDALLVAVVLRAVVRRAGAEAVRDGWPGPDASLAIVLQAAGARDAVRA